MSGKETASVSGGAQKPHEDHSQDTASAQVHKDPRAGDVGATGALDRAGDRLDTEAKSKDHGIDRVLKEDPKPHKDHGGDPAHATAHKDESANDVGASGAADRK